MRQKVPGRLAWAAAAVGALVGALVVLLHTPPAARWGRDWLIRQVASSASLDLALSRLDLNLFTRRLTAHDVRLAAPGHGDQPFFSAARVSVTLPWSALRGAVRLTTLDVERGRVWLVREGGALVNLPPSSGAPPPATPRRLVVDRLQVRDLDVDYEDRTGDAVVAVRDIAIALAPDGTSAAGTLAAAGVHVRLGERETTSGAVGGRMIFDGADVTLDALRAPFPEVAIVAGGAITRVLDDTRFALDLTGTFDVARLATWTPPPVPVSGEGTFSGRFTGPLGAYELRADFTAPALTIARAAGLPLTGTLVVTPPQAVVEPFRLVVPASPAAPRAAAVEGRFAYTFSRGSSVVDVAWRDLDLDAALAAYDQEPLTFAAWQQGTARLEVASSTAPMTLRASGASRAQARRDRVAVDGTWNAVLDGTRWTVRHDHRLLDTVRASGTMSWPVADDPARATLSGPLVVAITDVGPMVVAARRSGIDLSESLLGVHGPAEGALVMDGSMARMIVRGRVSSSALTLPSGAPGTAAADIVYDGDTLEATTFELTTPGARVTGDVVMGMESGRLGGTFRARADDLPRLAAPFAEVPGLSGVVDVAGTIGGTTDVPDVPFTVRSTPLAYDGQRAGALDVEARLLGTGVEFARLNVDQGPGRLAARGRVDYLTGAYDIVVDGRDLSWTNPQPGATVESLTAQMVFAGTGTLETPGGSGSLILTPVGGAIGDLVGDTDVRWQFAGGMLEATAFLSKVRTWVQGTVEPRAPYAFRGLAAVSALDVQPLLLAVGALPQAISGTAGLSASFEGRIDDLSATQAFVNLQDLQLSVGGLPVRLDRPARATVQTGDFSVDDLSLTAGGTTLTVAGRYHETAGQPLRASLTGDLGDLLALARAAGAAPAGVAVSGAVAATWESRGSIERAQSTVTVTGATVTPDGLPPVQALNATARYDGSTIVVDGLDATWQGARIAGRARVPRAVLRATAAAPSTVPGHVDLTLTGLTEQALTPWFTADTISRTDLTVAARAGLDVTSLSLDGLTGTLVFDEAAVTAAGVPISQAHPSRVSIARGVVSFDDVTFSAGTPVAIGGTVALGETTALDVRLTGTPGLRPFSVLSPAMSLDGAAAMDLRITGTPEAPRVHGRIDLDDAEVVMRDPRVIASDISGPIVFDGDRVTLDGLTGFLNGGDLQASGTARVLGVDVADGTFTVQARGVAVEYPENVDSEIDALLTFTAGHTPVLRGDVRVLRGAYRATISLPALVAFNATRTTVATQPGYLDRLALDVSVTTDEDVVVDNNYGRFEAGANVRLQGTAMRPSVTGRAELREGGEVFMLGGLYRLNESTISFSNPNAIEPEMNISMVTRSSGAEQTLTLTGTLDRLQTSVTSTDPGASTSVAELLLGGSTELRGDRALQLLSGELLGVTGRAVGLDSLRLERGFVASDIRQDPGLVADIDQDPSTRLTLSKQLRTDVEVVLSQGISQGALSGYVTYRPLRSVELRGTSLDNTDRLLSVRHDVSFGGTAVAPTPRRALGTVSAVTFSGASAEDEPALRARIKLGAGDRFDFIRWRDDVERVREWYRARGHLEARVRASRTDGTAGVALAYAVEPGPPTELRIEGMTVSGRLRARLEDAWSTAVFDRFLLEEIESALRLDLMQHDVVSAGIDAVVESTAPVKVIRATVRPGPAARRRRVVYEGNQTLTAAQLDGEITRWGLDDYGWLYPPLITNAITQRYDAEGHRTARVTAAEPAVEGGEALLRVTIDEGPVTTVASATLSGDARPLADDLRPALTALEGQPFRYGQLDDAMARITRRYQDAGFNNVRVTPVVTAPPGSTAATIDVQVDAGREQRLADVAVDGAKRTHPKAVVTALGLDPGDPVNFTAWAQARKRVFDTNVFRQVDVRPEVLPQPNADGTEAVRARVTVTEWPAWRLRYGLQLDDRSETGQGADTSAGRQQTLGVVANLQNRNLFGRALTFGVYGQAARRLQSGNTYLTFPTLFRRPLQTSLFAASSRQELPNPDGEFDTLRQRTLVSLEQRIRRGRTLQIAYGYRLKHEIIDSLIEDDPFLLDVVTGRFTGAAFYDRRDDPFNASRGWFAAVNLERLSEFESKEDAVKAQASVFHYQPIGPVVAASAVRIGGSFVNPLSFGERFYTGGADTVRGYAESFVGPKNFVGDARGGNALLLLNQEVRAPIYRWLRGVAFVDAGNVFDANGEISLSKLDVGYGVGLRLHTPFSIFRIDLGVPARGERVSTPDGIVLKRTARWYFGLGHIF